ncbi:MAG TPA: hypothetical protein VF494_12840 [Candidatus Limnocylindrales bacterium]
MGVRGEEGDPKTFRDSFRDALVSEVRLLAANSTDGPARVEVTGSGNEGRRTLGTVDASTTATPALPRG